MRLRRVFLGIGSYICLSPSWGRVQETPSKFMALVFVLARLADPWSPDVFTFRDWKTSTKLFSLRRYQRRRAMGLLYVVVVEMRDTIVLAEIIEFFFDPSNPFGLVLRI